MKFTIIFLIFVGLSWSQQYPKIKQQHLDIKPDGTYQYLYETENGIYADQQGYALGADSFGAQGQYQYLSPEGQFFHLSYVADENGYQLKGDHLPTPPPIPPAIQKALKYLESQGN